MYQPEDALLLLIWEMTRDPDRPVVTVSELAYQVHATKNRAIPSSPGAIDRMLEDLNDAALVEVRPWPPEVRERGHRAFALTEEGQARSWELQTEDQ
jgi:hypothetical protein